MAVLTNIRAPAGVYIPLDYELICSYMEESPIFGMFIYKEQTNQAKWHMMIYCTINSTWIPLKRHDTITTLYGLLNAFWEYKVDKMQLNAYYTSREIRTNGFILGRMSGLTVRCIPLLDADEQPEGLKLVVRDDVINNEFVRLTYSIDDCQDLFRALSAMRPTINENIGKINALLLKSRALTAFEKEMRPPILDDKEETASSIKKVKI